MTGQQHWEPEAASQPSTPTSIVTPDELSLCGEEVCEMFKGTFCITGTATMMQLSLDVRRLTTVVEKLKETLRRQRG